MEAEEEEFWEGRDVLPRPMLVLPRPPNFPPGREAAVDVMLWIE